MARLGGRALLHTTAWVMKGKLDTPLKSPLLYFPPLLLTKIKSAISVTASYKRTSNLFLKAERRSKRIYANDSRSLET